MDNLNPILYPVGETAFDTNGIGILGDAILVDVIEQLNGQYELEMQYPVTGLHFSSIARDCILLAKPNPVTDPQPFSIYRITKPMSGIITVYARHIAYDLMGITVAPFASQSCATALQDLKNNATTACPFDFWTDKSTVATMTVSVPKSIWAQLGGSSGSVLDVYGGEYEFDRYNVKLHNRRGADRGVSIRYGKNLTSLEQDENCANVYTGVHPYWTNLEGALVQLPEKILHAEGNFAKTKIKPLDLSLEFETQPTEGQLRTRAQKYMLDNDIGTPTVSWKVEFVQLEQTEEYKGKALLERVLLGDTVSVAFTEMGVSASARAVSMRYDSLQGRYKSVSLGSVRSNIADTIAKQQQEIAQKPTVSLVEEIALAEAKTLTQDDVLNMLTNNGATQGFYVVDGKLYINAELVKILNLIADHVLSEGADSSMEIEGGVLILKAGGEKCFQVYASDSPIMYFDEDAHHGEMTAHHLKIGGTSVMPCVYIAAGEQLAASHESLSDGGVIMAQHGSIGSMRLDSILPTGSGNCKWEYLSSIGKTVLVKA